MTEKLGWVSIVSCICKLIVTYKSRMTIFKAIQPYVSYVNADCCPYSWNVNHSLFGKYRPIQILKRSIFALWFVANIAVKHSGI